MSVFNLLTRLFSSRSGAATDSAGASRASRHDGEHEPVEDWFVRTTRVVLGSLRTGAGRAQRRPSPLQQKIATLEAQNASLRVEVQRLADEVVALRTLTYLRPGKTRRKGARHE